MTTSTEALLVDISDKLGNITEAYVRLEVTTRTDNLGIREDIAGLRADFREMSQTLADHANRITAGETRIHALRDDSDSVAALKIRVSVLETQLAHITPQRTPWTAIASALVAIGALAWTLFGR